MGDAGPARAGDGTRAEPGAPKRKAEKGKGQDWLEPEIKKQFRIAAGEEGEKTGTGSDPQNIIKKVAPPVYKNTEVYYDHNLSPVSYENGTRESD